MTTSSAVRLEPYGPLWFEEPGPPDQMDGIATMAAKTTIPVATGERLTTRIEFHAALKAGVSILQPNVGRSGGIWETKKVAALAEVFNAQVAPHISCDPVAHAAAAHVVFSCPNFLILETIQSDFHDAVLKQSINWEDGYLQPPTEPGLGIGIDLATVAEHPYVAGGRLHLDMCQTPLASANQRTIGEIE